MSEKYYIYSGKKITRKKVEITPAPIVPANTVKKVSTRSVGMLITCVCAAALLVYSYIFASGNLDEYIDRSTYEHLDGMYIGGLGEAAYVFSQKIENSVLAGILGLDYLNSEEMGEAVYTSNFGK